jgi:hypothetical protein
MAGNAGMRRLLRQGDISVHEGSRMTGTQFATALKNKKVPAQVRKAISDTRGSLHAGSGVKAGSYEEGFNAAFAKGKSEITTASSEITVTLDAPGALQFQQVVTPDLARGEQVGRLIKNLDPAGNPIEEFSRHPFVSTASELIFGWTPGEFGTNKRREQRILIMIVTQMTVTNPAGETKRFKPTDDEIAETMLHEIALHAGLQSLGKPDADNDTAARNAFIEEIEDFFRKRDPNTKQIAASKTTTAVTDFIEKGRQNALANRKGRTGSYSPTARGQTIPP